MARKYKQGFYTVKNPDKYLGDVKNVIYRSGWELKVFQYLDFSDEIVKWNSEDVKIPYICMTDKKPHTYYVDFFVIFKSGVKALIEVKPVKDTVPAKMGRGRKVSTIINETLTYQKNMSKWQAAKAFAADRGMVFMVWTENTLNRLGMST